MDVKGYEQLATCRHSLANLSIWAHETGLGREKSVFGIIEGGRGTKGLGNAIFSIKFAF